MKRGEESPLFLTKHRYSANLHIDENHGHYLMNRALFIRLLGLAGFLLFLGGYCLLWISPDAELEEVIVRTRIAIIMNLSGAICVVYYLFRK